MGRPDAAPFNQHLGALPMGWHCVWPPPPLRAPRKHFIPVLSMHTIVHTIAVTALDFVPATSPPSFSCSSRFTFEVAGEFYMIPAHDNEADIRLFRCVKWPSKWKFEATLLQPSNQVADVSLVQWQVHVTSRPAGGNDLTVVAEHNRATSTCSFPHLKPRPTGWSCGSLET